MAAQSSEAGANNMAGMNSGAQWVGDSLGAVLTSLLYGFMKISLPSLVPNAADFLTLPVEDVAEVLLVHLNSYPDGGNEVAQQGKINQNGFFGTLHRQRPYPDYNNDVRRVLLEAWSWLESERSEEHTSEL